jgi:hypothetical protein
MFFYAVGAEKKGPFSLEELKEQHFVFPDTLVWRKGLESWVPASDLKELNAIISDAPPPLPTEKKLSLENKGSFGANEIEKIEIKNINNISILTSGFGLFIGSVFLYMFYASLDQNGQESLEWGAVILSLIVRLFAVSQIRPAAVKYNRDIDGWSFAAFFFPIFSLLILGFLKKKKIEYSSLSKKVLIEEWHELAAKKMNYSYFSDALEMYRLILGESPNDSRAIGKIYFLAKKYFNEHNFEVSFNLYNYYFEFDSTNTDAIYERAIASIRIGNIDFSKKELLKLQDSKSYRLDVLRILGNMAASDKNYSVARGYWSLASEEGCEKSKEKLLNS